MVNRSQPEVSRLLREIGEPARTWLTARNASEAIREELQHGDDDFALRTLINDFRDHKDSTEIQEFLRRPHPTGDRRWDTLLAAAVAPGLQATRSQRT